MGNENVKDRNLTRFTEQMQHVDELAVTVLKGHLVLEEQLDRIVSKFLFHPKHLDAANLRFHQKAKVAQCMSLDEHDNSVWELLLAINSLRNHLAHSLEPEKRQQRFDRVKTMFDSEHDSSGIETAQMRDHEIVAFAVAMVLGFLSSFEEEVERYRDWVATLDKVVNPHRHGPDAQPKETDEQSVGHGAADSNG